ncbi:hypothetical protein D083_3184 [Dickeya solani RNS 08.23.3.1.A]|nr:hypothetical protein D083_3184 [Dickeya solani RNS 08.23.3.1.A]
MRWLKKPPRFIVLCPDDRSGPICFIFGIIFLVNYICFYFPSWHWCFIYNFIFFLFIRIFSVCFI